MIVRLHKLGQPEPEQFLWQSGFSESFLFSTPSPDEVWVPCHCCLWVA